MCDEENEYIGVTQSQSRTNFNNSPLATHTIKKKYRFKLASPKKAVKTLNKTKVTICKKKSLRLNVSGDDLPYFGISKSKKKYSDSFKKYSFSLPTYEEIIAEEKLLNIFKKQLLELEELIKIELVSFPPPTKSPIIMLDCKHLTIENISEYFHNSVTYLRHILTGKISCVRHEIFCTNEISGDLIYNNSMIVFTFDQIDSMVPLMEKEFDTDKISLGDKIVNQFNKKGYFFKVLIPIFCLKIFMEEHKMSESEAREYLSKRPVE